MFFHFFLTLRKIYSKMENNNAVNHPNHYNNGNIECFDVIKAFYGEDSFEDFCLGNVLKYVMRCRHKGKYLEDLKKAKFYIEEIINLKQSEDKD